MYNCLYTESFRFWCLLTQRIRVWCLHFSILDPKVLRLPDSHVSIYTTWRTWFGARPKTFMDTYMYRWHSFTVHICTFLGLVVITLLLMNFRHGSNVVSVYMKHNLHGSHTIHHAGNTARVFIKLWAWSTIMYFFLKICPVMINMHNIEVFNR